MPRNASGTYTLPLPPVIPDTTIESAWANTSLDDLAQSLTDSLDRYGRGGMVAPFRLVDGTVGAPALSFTSETGTGLYRESAGVMSLAIQGGKVAQWSTSGLGVTGAIRIANTPETNAGRLFVDDSVVGLETRYAKPLTFGTDATERMRISSDGNLGLGAVPNGTGGSWRSLQMAGGSGLVAGYSEVDLVNQAYAGGVGTFNYFADAAPAARYAQSQGTHFWYTAAAGAQGATIPWVDLMQIGPDKNLQVQGSVLAYGGVVSAVRNTGYGSSPDTEIRCGTSNSGDVNNDQTYRWDWRVTGDSNGFAYTLLRQRRSAAEVGVLNIDRFGNVVVASGRFQVNGNQVVAATTVGGVGVVDTGIRANAGYGGGMVLVVGADVSGLHWSTVWVLAVQVAGGGDGNNVGQSMIGSSGPGVVPGITFSRSGDAILMSISGGSANQSHCFPLGGFGVS